MLGDEVVPRLALGILNLDVESDRITSQENTPGFLRNDETLPFKVKREIVARWLVPKFTDS